MSNWVVLAAATLLLSCSSTATEVRHECGLQYEVVENEEHQAHRYKILLAELEDISPLKCLLTELGINQTVSLDELMSGTPVFAESERFSQIILIVDSGILKIDVTF